MIEILRMALGDFAELHDAVDFGNDGGFAVLAGFEQILLSAARPRGPGLRFGRRMNIECSRKRSQMLVVSGARSRVPAVL